VHNNLSILSYYKRKLAVYAGIALQFIAIQFINYSSTTSGVLGLNFCNRRPANRGQRYVMQIVGDNFTRYGNSQLRLLATIFLK